MQAAPIASAPTLLDMRGAGSAVRRRVGRVKLGICMRLSIPGKEL